MRAVQAVDEVGQLALRHAPHVVPLAEAFDDHARVERACGRLDEEVRLGPGDRGRFVEEHAQRYHIRRRFR